MPQTQAAKTILASMAEDKPDDASVGSFSSNEPTESHRTDANSSNNADIRETAKILRKDSWIQSLRFLSLCVLLVVAYVVAMTVYISLKESEKRNFEDSFEAHAIEIERGIQDELSLRVKELDALAISITSYAQSRSPTKWPRVTLPEFAYRTANTLVIGKGLALQLQPIVYKENLTEWEEYAVQEQGWLEEGRLFQSLFPEVVTIVDSLENKIDDADADDIEHGQQNISKFVFRVDDGLPFRADGDILMPLWQYSPVYNDLPYVNYDKYGKERNRGALDELLKNHAAVIGPVFELSQSLHGNDFNLLGSKILDQDWETTWKGNLDNDANVTHFHHSDMSGPAANIWYPIFGTLEVSENRKPVAVLGMTIRWDSLFLSRVPKESVGIFAVFSSKCGQVFSYKISENEAEYLGPEDIHEETYEYYEEEYVFSSERSVFSNIALSNDFCQYHVKIYPSLEMQESYATNEPTSFGIGVACIFLFVMVVFLGYDTMVERRQKYLAESAHKTNVIVSALFPKIVRDRLFEEPTKENGKSKAFKSTNQTLEERQQATIQGAPIADLFPNTTVLFADIAGFTAWSSSRQPSEVFTLLETLYSAFDKIAKGMGVFKVETIGDCYMAVTGLPVPQEDHHLRMVRFSRHMLSKMQVLLREMEVSLGPQTTDLALRIGLHSGPVTAGVLRGEKSRFQLFGDTVNTASRMESTGKRNQIQVSQTTASLIEGSGKGHWMKKREDLVEAKGKGTVQTYWIKSKVSSNSSGGMSSSDDLASNSSGFFVAKDLTKQESLRRMGVRKSLVDWQVELLGGLLKQIIVYREATNQKQEVLDNLDAMQMPPRDEIAEKIEIPNVNGQLKLLRSLSCDGIELPREVSLQLEELVATIANLYNDHHFHNCEHACHMTMSANKLLKRIVVPAFDTDSSIRETNNYTYGLVSDPLTQFAIIFAAIIHDLDHFGVSNGQLVKEKHRLATMYRDKSVLEQNSIDLAFEALTSPQYTELVSCICGNEKEYTRFRQLVVNCVMATDIFDPELLHFRNNRWKKAFDVEDGSESDLKATIVIEHIMQAADVAHTMQHWHVYQRWNELLFNERMAAFEAGRGGDKDPALGWYDGELWFFDNYVIPLGKKLDECGVFGVSSDECLSYAVANRQEWAEKGKQCVEDMYKRYQAKTAKEKAANSG